MGSIKCTVDHTPLSLPLSLSLQSNDVIALEANNERIQDLYYLLLDSSSSSCSSSSSSSCTSNTTSAATTSNSSSTSTPIYSPCGGMRQSNHALSPYKIGPDREIFINQIKDERDGKDDKEMESEQDEKDEIMGSNMSYKEDNVITLKSLRVITDSENVLQDVEKVRYLLLFYAMLPCPVLPYPIACSAVLCYHVVSIVRFLLFCCSSQCRYGATYFV